MHTEGRPIYQIEWRRWIYQRCYCNSVGTSLEQNEVWQFHSFSCHLFESQAFWRTSSVLQKVINPDSSSMLPFSLTGGNPKETWKLLKFGVLEDVPVSVPPTPDIPKTAVNRVWKEGQMGFTNLSSKYPSVKTWISRHDVTHLIWWMRWLLTCCSQVLPNFWVDIVDHGRFLECKSSPPNLFMCPDDYTKGSPWVVPITSLWSFWHKMPASSVFPGHFGVSGVRICCWSHFFVARSGGRSWEATGNGWFWHVIHGFSKGSETCSC